MKSGRGRAVQAMMCSTNQAHLQYMQQCAVQASKSLSFGTGGDTTQEYFPMTYQVKIASSLWQVTTIS